MIYRPCVDCGADTPLHSPRCFRCVDARSSFTVVHKIVIAVSVALIVAGLYVLSRSY